MGAPGGTAHFQEMLHPMARFTSAEQIAGYHWPDFLEDYRWDGVRERFQEIEARDLVGAAFMEMKERFGGELAFWGCIGTQTTMPFGKPEDVKHAARNLIATVGEGGGLLLILLIHFGFRRHAGGLHRLPAFRTLLALPFLVELVPGSGEKLPRFIVAFSTPAFMASDRAKFWVEIGSLEAWCFCGLVRRQHDILEPVFVGDISEAGKSEDAVVGGVAGGEIVGEFLPLGIEFDIHPPEHAGAILLGADKGNNGNVLFGFGFEADAILCAGADFAEEPVHAGIHDIVGAGLGPFAASLDIDAERRFIIRLFDGHPGGNLLGKGKRPRGPVVGEFVVGDQLGFRPQIRRTKEKPEGRENRWQSHERKDSCAGTEG
jgi:hypothetical protein